MGTRFKDYPVYTYDEPAVYSDFLGGLNTDPSNDHLLDSELRDVTNMTYLSGALVKRKGAHKLCDVSSPERLTFVQGVFLFTYRITYIVIAADGKLFQGVYNEDATIELRRLYIRKYDQIREFAFDETNPFEGIEEKTESEQSVMTKHDGFTQTFFINNFDGDTFQRNFRGNYSDVESGLIAKGDTFQDDSGLLSRQFVCIKEFAKTIRYPDSSNYWEYLKQPNTAMRATEYSVERDGEDPLVLNASSTEAEWEEAEQHNVFRWESSDSKAWRLGDVVYYGGFFLRCLQEHSNDAKRLYDPEYFYNLSDLNQNVYAQETYLVFQNHSKVEAATFDNKLYVATGTRIIEVYLDTDELRARPLPPYMCNYTEITNIGYNYLSPYPELAVASKGDAVYTEMDGIKVRKTVTGTYLLTPIMHIAANDDVSNYFFRWEKFVNGVWYTVIPYRGQIVSAPDSLGADPTAPNMAQIEVDDADKVRYRVSFASDFKSTSDSAREWDVDETYSKNEVVFVGSKLYRCRIAHSPSTIYYPGNEFSAVAKIAEYSDGETVWTERTVWEQVYDLEVLPFIYKTVNGDTGETEWNATNVYDYVPNPIMNNANRSATSVLFEDIAVDDTFKLIHSCKSVLTDGSKLLFYNDAYNSGQWFKTVINNPYYISQRGSLSFKTSKNEALVKVIPFQGNLIAFANSKDSGGSIHLVQGNGDDYDDGSGYYSPYRRSTINESISCDDPKTVQVCDNYLIFKHFRIVYCINASDLSNDVVRVTQCNDRVLERNGEVFVPWDEPCVSEVTDSYYALIWPKRYDADDDGELVLAHPGMRMKMYFNTQVQRKDGSYGFPWLKDEGECFGLNEVFYIRGRPMHLYKNIVVTYDEDDYRDLGKDYDCVIRTKAMGLNYPDQYKFVERAIVSYHRDQSNPIDLSLEVRNEAGHTIIDPDSKRLSVGNLGVIRVGSQAAKESLRLTSTVRDDRAFNSINMFPCLLAEAKITARTKGSFTLTAVTYHYTSCDNPDTTPYDTYTGIIRPKEVN